MPPTIRHVAVPLYDLKHRPPSVAVIVAAMLAHGKGAKRYVVDPDQGAASQADATAAAATAAVRGVTWTRNRSRHSCEKV